jgi:hypothetical protein
MALTIEGEGRQVREQTKSANLTGITDDRGDYRKRTFKPFRLRHSAFNTHEAFIMPDMCYCGDGNKDHDSQGCGVCGHIERFVP